MEEFFNRIALTVAAVAEVGAVLIIAFGTLQAIVGLFQYAVGREHSPGARKRIWLSLAIWLLLGLEFQLAADIVRSVISPDWDDIGKLAAVAVVRTFLNYFLEKDLEKYAEPETKPA